MRNLFFLTKLRPFLDIEMFRFIAITFDEFVFSTHSTFFFFFFFFLKIDLKLCTYFTGEDAYLPFDGQNKCHFKL